MMKETTNPPLPQLGISAGKGGAWEPAQDQTYFMVRFHPSLKDHKRCLWRILYIGQNFAIHYAVAVVIIFFFCLVGTFLIESWSANKWINPTPSLLVHAGMQTFSFCLMGPMTRRIVITEQIKKIVRAQMPPSALTAKSNGLLCDAGVEKFEIAYTDIFSVIYHRGDLYIRGNGQKSFYVPASTFADNGISMETLYKTLYTLWQNNGALESLSPELRSRFILESTESREHPC